MPPLVEELRGGIELVPRAVRPDGANEATPLSGNGKAARGSVGGSRPVEAVETHARESDDRYDEEFHDGSFLGSGVA
jgi:hypothetical protein